MAPATTTWDTPRATVCRRLSREEHETHGEEAARKEPLQRGVVRLLR